MKKIVSVALVCLLVLSGFVGLLNFTSEQAEGQLADTPWPMFRGGLKHTGRSPYNTSHVDGTEKWKFDTKRDLYSSPAIGSDGTIYIGAETRDYPGADEGKLYAVNSDGTEKWSFSIPYDITSSPAIGSDGSIYIGSRDELIAINSDGSQKWNFSLPSFIQYQSSPAIGGDGTIYVGSSDGLYAVNPDGTKKWNFAAADYVDSSAAIGSDGTIYVGSEYHLFAVNPNGTKKWSFFTNSHVRSSPAIGDDGTIYVGCIDGNLYAVNPDGTERWNYTTNRDVYSSPAIGRDGTIYIGSTDNKFYAINPDGTEKWNFSTGRSVISSPAIGGDGTIYVGSIDNNLYAIYPNGTKKWNFSTGDYVASSPAIGSDGTVYIGSDDGHLYAIGGAPSAPRDLQANAGDNRVNLTWEPPSDKGGSSIVEYKIYRATKDWDVFYHDNVSGSVTSYTDLNLTNGKLYRYKISAVNEDAEGPKSNEVSAVPIGPPSAPQDLHAVAGDGWINLTWGPPSNDGGRNITGYKVYRRRNSSTLSYLNSTDESVGYYNDTGLTNGQTYHYNISAVNSLGEGEKSPGVNATPLTTPTAPQDLQAAVGHRRVNLTWDPPLDDGGTNITEYKIYRANGDENLSYHDNVSAVVTSYTDTGLINGRVYSYWVSAVNSEGEGNISDELTAAPMTTPEAPRDLSVSPGEGYINLTWAAPSDDGGSSITGYRIYRGTSSGDLSHLKSIGNVTHFKDTDLSGGKTYHYKVSAVNDAGEGNMSGVVNASPNSSIADLLSSYWWLIAAIVIGVVAVFIVLKKKEFF